MPPPHRSPPGAGWETVSAEAKDFVRRCLTAHPEQRLTAPQALAHPWLAPHHPEATPGPCPAPPVPGSDGRVCAWLAAKGTRLCVQGLVTRQGNLDGNPGDHMSPPTPSFSRRGSRGWGVLIDQGDEE